MGATAPVAILIALLSASEATPPLEAAREHLRANRLDDVLFALEGRAFSGAEARTAASLLATAGRRALESDDTVMALQFVQMALRHESANELALEVGARAALAQEQPELAEAWSGKLLELRPRDPAARLLAARSAFGQRQWGRAAEWVDRLDKSKLSRADQRLLADLRDAARLAQQRERDEAAEQQATEARLEDALARARALDRVIEPERRAPDVVIYTRPWCGACKRATAWMRKQQIPFEEIDLEDRSTGASAEQELKAKCQRARISSSGVPVFEIGGKMISGFSEESVLDALGKSAPRPRPSSER